MQMINLTNLLFGPFANKIISTIDSLDIQKRTRKLSTKDALECILYLYKTGIQWRYVPFDNVHYTTLYKRFIKWCRLDVFKNLWAQFLNIYTKRKMTIDKSWFKVLIIDSTSIKNVSGVDYIGYHPKEPSKKATKVSVLCDKAKVPVALEFFPANIHDVKTIKSTLDKLTSFKMLKDKRHKQTLLGDKGYITKEKFKKYTSGNMFKK